ncbi:MAG: hypothetical protein GXP19_03005 [Gammaproteobacteria bacterium]|nr:hypothetical protein [Gammaproteobacteria bacterium]
MNLTNFVSRKSAFLKFVGVILLIAYLLTTPFTFDIIWLMMGLLVSFSAFLFYILTVVTFNNFNGVEGYNEQQQFVKSKRTWDARLAGAEDGVFLLPLLFIGIDPLSVGIASILFWVYNYPKFSKLYCTVKTIAFFIVGLWILPYGIWPVVLSHIIVDTLVTYNLSSWLELEDETAKDV